jgi:formylglycine-generating enzyme required for sulfatase activity
LEACGPQGICAGARSCSAHNGGDTCGPNGNEDCCTSISVPRAAAPYRLDKYVVTAGRYRRFVEATNGDVRGWVQTHTPAWWDPVWDAWLPTVLDDGTYGGKNGVYQQLGPALLIPDDAGGNAGCAISGIGARTYWVPPAINQARFNETQDYDQATLDQKPLVCATFMMFAAFCAWDGGRVADLAEIEYAWNKGDPDTYLFPWGKARPAGWEYAYTTEADALSYGVEHCNPFGVDPCDRTLASYRYNSWTPAGVAAGDKDRSIFIPQPGRFPKGNGPFGHADLAGLVFTVSGSLYGAKGDDPATRQTMWSRAGSWQGHGMPFYQGAPPLGWAMASKYLATGGRCAR